MYTGRQQKNEAGNKVSRQVECGTRQRVQMRDGRKNTIFSPKMNNNITQYYLGISRDDSTFVCRCTANVDLDVENGGVKKNISTKGEGANSGKLGNGKKTGSDSDVLNIFKYWRLNNLASIKKVAKANPPGRCAEPHAVADALLNLNYNLNLNLNPKDVKSVTKITVSNAECKDETIKQNCETCKQWIADNQVKANYLILKP